jgi:hypothetical protein
MDMPFETETHELRGVEYRVFFVLNGLENGARGFPCYSEDGKSIIADGWYFGVSDDEEFGAPFKSYEDAREAAVCYIEAGWYEAS